MAQATILLVDDDPFNLSVLRSLLARDGYDLVAADLGQSALDLVTGNPSFDLVLLDAVLPDVDGVEVCRRLKANPKTAHIPILLVSAFRTDDDSIRDGLDAGADGYLTKPIEDLALRAWIKAALRIGNLQQQLTTCAGPVPKGCEDVLEAAAGLSRAVNAPLQAVYASADMLASELEKDSPHQDRIHDIHAHAERVASLVAHVSRLAKERLKLTPSGTPRSR